MIAVGIKSVSKSYDGKTLVLDRVDLDVQQGEMFFLLGASGCGKTTLLRLVAGFLTPDSGTVHFGDRDVTRLPAEERGIGMVFQNYALWPHLTVAENVAFGLDVRRVPAPEKRARVEEALALVELPDYGERRIAELSGGQQQRVALARAIVIKPQVLLLDEPLSNLDARLRVAMRAEIRRVCKAAGVTALYVTHDQSEALSTADRIALLVNGAVAQVGTPRDLYERPATRAVAQFVGEANLLSGFIGGPGRVRFAMATLTAAAMPPGLKQDDHVTVCIRPERLRIDPGAAANRISATIVESSYLGAYGQWRLVTDDGTPLTVNEPSPPARAVGDRLSLTVSPDDVVVLPA